MSAAYLYGDPHMITFDGFKYTFNGVGEYVALNALDGEFILQARSKPAEDTNNGLPVSTASFSAFAMQMRNSDTVEIQRSSFGGLNILVNGNRLSMSGDIEQSFNDVTVSSVNFGSTALVIFTEGPTIKIQNRKNFLLLEVASFPAKYHGSTKGLLGVWNGDPKDDLLRPDGIVLPPESTLKEIHKSFGELCKFKIL